MVDEPVGISDVEQLEELEEGDGSRRPRLALALILLLLLLLCSVTTVADVWTTAPTAEQRTAILRNIECLRCHTELMPQFSMDWVHNPFMKKDCTTCHTPHGEIVRTVKTLGPLERWQRLRTLIEWLPLRIACDIAPSTVTNVETTGTVGTTYTETENRGKKSELTLPEDQLCWMCHGDLGPKRAMIFQHNPFIRGRCTSCHDPHASNHAKILKQDARDLCVTCHPMGQQLNRAQTHPPVKNLYCLTCHDPHASDWRGVLKKRQTELCFTCHPSVAPLSSLAVQHKPFSDDDCTGCHEPHGSDFRPLLRSDPPALCYRCHPGVKYDFLKPSHHPVGTVTLNCQGCHNPHAANYEFLLDARDNQFCYKCHSTARGAAYAIKPTYEPSAHAKNAILCVKCHTPHGSAYGPLLRKRNPEVCLDCHAPTVVGANKHPFRPTLWDVYSRKPLTCTSTCHNPHGTNQNYMLQRFSWPYDGQCLQCHSRVGKDF